MSSNVRNISYYNKDFTNLKEQLIELAKNYFPDTYADFSTTSPGMMFIEMAAYVGDILSFYLDNQVQETFLQYAKNPVNLYAMAYMMGYKPKVTTVSETMLTVMQRIPAVLQSGSYVPDWSKAGRIAENSRVVSDTQSEVSFLFKEPLDFHYSSSYDPTKISINDVDQDGNPVDFILEKSTKVYSGEIKQTTVHVGEYKKYRTISLEDSNIVGILSITDSDNNVWTEVPCLGQDTVFVDEAVSGSATKLLRLEKVSRRFTTRFTSKGKLQIQFGAGMYAEDEDESYYPNPHSLDDTQILSSERYDISYDPSNFLFSKSYGLAPVNTDLTIRYVIGGGVQSNVLANTITKIGELYLSGDTDVNNYSFYNLNPAVGGRDGDSLEEVRQNSLRSFAEQKRVVTLQDYNIRALSLPAKYGTVSKAYAVHESLNGVSSLNQNPLATTLFVLSKDVNGKLTYTSTIVKNNLKTYLSDYLMVTDAVDIKDAYIVNIKVQYDIVIKPNYQPKDVLLACNSVLQSYFNTNNWQINDTINLSELYTKLDDVVGVQTVKDIKISNIYGEGYSEYAYDIAAATRDKVVYPSYDPCIFEVRYPEKDIEGRVVTL